MKLVRREESFWFTMPESSSCVGRNTLKKRKKLFKKRGHFLRLWQKDEFSTVSIMNPILGARPKFAILVLLKETARQPTTVGKR